MYSSPKAARSCVWVAQEADLSHYFVFRDPGVLVPDLALSAELTDSTPILSASLAATDLIFVTIIDPTVSFTRQNSA